MSYTIHKSTEDFTLTTDIVESTAKRKVKRVYRNVVTAFDIETTRLENDQSIMYIWTFAIGRHDVYIGRTWEELEDFILRICSQIKDGEKLVCVVHNLSYEFFFLRTIYNFKQDEVFALKPRKIVKCTMYDKIEFRCSYIHSNMSLAEYTNKMDVEHKKLSGEEFDYSVKRYPDTPLTDRELEYCCHDTIGLVEAYEKEMELEGDDLVTIPMTSTGYVRRECRQAMSVMSPYVIQQSQPGREEYHIMKQAFRGGDTHASRFYATQIIENVKSVDRSSSYPDVMCNDVFPYGSGRWIKNLSQRQFAFANSRENYQYFARVILRNVRLKDRFWGFPYIPFGKCIKFSSNHVLDNGRILSADMVELCVTNIDFQIISETYTFRVECPELLFYQTAPLPEPLIKTTQKYYKDKTELKGIPEQEVYYTKQKNKLNSLYGMCATDPVRMSFLFDETHKNLFRVEEKNIAETLIKNRYKNFLLFQWACFITATARLRLYEAQKIAGDNCVYCDTDSVKYVGDVDFTEYNRKRIERSKATGSFATDKHGEIHYMGVMESEKMYRKFVTFGSKKYAYEYEDGKPHVTISGVNKKEGGQELENRGGLKSLKEGFIFRAGGGVELVYNDTTPRQIVTENGHSYTIGPNVCIKPSTYTLSTTADYKDIIANPYLVEKIKHKLGFAD